MVVQYVRWSIDVAKLQERHTLSKGPPQVQVHVAPQSTQQPVPVGRWTGGKSRARAGAAMYTYGQGSYCLIGTRKWQSTATTVERSQAATAISITYHSSALSSSRVCMLSFWFPPVVVTPRGIEWAAIAGSRSRDLDTAADAWHPNLQALCTRSVPIVHYSSALWVFP